MELAASLHPEFFVLHRNVRLNLHGRRLLVQRVRVLGRPVAHVAKELGISRPCAQMWVNRFDAEVSVPPSGGGMR
jgi:transposase